MRVLVVDDNPLALWAMLQLVRHLGHEVIGAASGAAALDLLDAEEVDAVILDYYLGDTTGEELLPLVRRVSRAPVIALSGVPVAGAFDGHLLKPTTAAEVAAALARGLQ